jgi:NAD(P)H dehydrogenase (quinone)
MLIITGASGQIGRSVIARVSARFPRSEIVLVTRRPDLLAATHPGFDIRFGDYDNLASLPSAFRGGSTLLLTSTLQVGKRAAQHEAAIAAARVAGIRRIVYTSADGIHPDCQATIAIDHRITEKLLRESGLDFTIHRHSLITETLLFTAARAYALGGWRNSAHGGRAAFVAREDCAACLAVTLTTSGHSGQTYAITGPTAITLNEVAVIAAEVTGLPLSIVDATDAEVDADLARAGLPERYEEGVNVGGVTFGRIDIVTAWSGMRDAYFETVSDTVFDLTNQPPQSVREVFDAQKNTLLAHRDFLSARIGTVRH